MLLPSTQSFTPLATIHLPAPHILHPDACNPAMDLVVLLAPVQGSSSTIPSRIASAKGKGRDIPSQQGMHITKVALWRMSGSKVWEVELGGKVGGLAWSPDGLHLSILLFRYPPLPNTFLREGEKWKVRKASIEHLSVHTGATVKSVPYLRAIDGPSEDERETPEDGSPWWEMTWEQDIEDWPKPANGSSLMIIDSLPRPTPVDPPKPPGAQIFLMTNPSAITASKLGPHEHLLGFPSLLPAVTRSEVDYLTITSPGGRQSESLLTGTFCLPSHTRRSSRSFLRLAQISDRMANLLNIVLRGLEACQNAYKDGVKQTIIWREELETCADQQAMSKLDVHADLFRLLMTGRCGAAVSEWLGNRLTGRTITKWEHTLETSFSTIRKVIAQSIVPAVERVILLLEELRGWALPGSMTQGLYLDQDAIGRSLFTCMGLDMLLERIRQDADHEMQAAADFIKWLKYELARTAAQDPDQSSVPTSLHDVKLAWSFMKNGFITSPLAVHFPSIGNEANNEVLPKSYDVYPQEQSRPLNAVLRDSFTLLATRLHGPHPGIHDHLASPSMPDASIYSSIADPSVEAATPLREVSPEILNSPDSIDTLAPDQVRKHEDMPRTFDQEPWVWAQTLVERCQALITTAAVKTPNENAKETGIFPSSIQRLAKMSAIRCTDVGNWIASIPASPSLLVLFHLSTSDKSTIRVSAFALPGAACLTLQFFDDEELALIIEETAAASATSRYLITVRFVDLIAKGQTLPSDGVDRVTKFDELLDQLNIGSPETLPELPVARCRLISTGNQSSEDPFSVGLALNGRKGRRVGCMQLGEGREIEVLDMEDEDEAADEAAEMGDESMGA